MTLIKDKFIFYLVVVTLIVISGMYVLHLRLGEQIQYVERRLAPAVNPHLPPNGPFKITNVIDGDTIGIDNGETVRLIGIDAPETHHSEVPVQRFGEESAEFLRRLVNGYECTLEYEPGEIRDKYYRILAYVFVGDKLINAEVIRRGYAYVYTRFPFKRQKEFLMLEREAREKQYGIWALSLRDGRISNLVNRYESLNIEGRKKLDEVMDQLVKEYAFDEK